MVKALESQRNRKRRSLFDAQDEVDRRREELIADIEGKLAQVATLEEFVHGAMGVAMSTEMPPEVAQTANYCH